MKRKINKFVLYIGSIILISSGVKIKLCNDESKKYTKEVEEYINDFKSDNFLIAAHRGFSSKEVENTKDAISLASTAPYIDYIEMDVRLTNDNKLILSHDNSLFSSNMCYIKISEEDTKDINNQKFIYFSDRLPIEIESIFNDTNGDILRTRSKELNKNEYNLVSLKEALKKCDGKKILLDLKFNNNTKKYVKELIRELEDIDTSNITFQSDDFISLLYLKNKKPDYNISAIIRTKQDLDYAPLFDNLCIRKNLVDEKVVTKLLKEVNEISVWTLNDENEINEVIDNLKDQYKNVIYITDYPDVVAKCLNDKEKKIKR